MLKTDLLYYILIGLSILVNVFSLFFLRRNKNKKTNEPIPEDNSNEDVVEKLSFMEILSRIPTYMVQAEELYNNLVSPAIKKTGAQKLADVLNKVKLDCLTNDVEYNEQVVIDEVEKLTELTKRVNS